MNISSRDISSGDATSALAAIVRDDLCHRCGTCAGVCPSGAIALDSRGYPQIDKHACTECMSCIRSCPGAELNAPRIGEDYGGGAFDSHSLYGQFKQSYLAYAVDETVRKRSCSGGFVTALLVFLFTFGLIDGAVVAEADVEKPWKAKGKIARSVNDIVNAAGSKYVVTPLNAVLSEILAVPGRYAFVGLPCHIHGLHKAAAIFPELKKRIALTIGLLCHAALEPELPEHICRHCSGNGGPPINRFHYRYGKHSGSPVIEFKDGTLKHALFPRTSGYQPSTIEAVNVFFRIFTPRRCLTCFDATSEFSDISAGDPWFTRPLHPPVDFQQGFTYALCRTEAGLKAVTEAAKHGFVCLRSLTSDEARTCNVQMVQEKKLRAFYYLKQKRGRDLPAPDYKFTSPPVVLSSAMRLHLFSYVFCFLGRGRNIALRFLLSLPGYWAFYILHLRRRLRAKRDSEYRAP